MRGRWVVGKEVMRVDRAGALGDFARSCLLPLVAVAAARPGSCHVALEAAAVLLEQVIACILLPKPVVVSISWGFVGNNSIICVFSFAEATVMLF